MKGKKVHYRKLFKVKNSNKYQDLIENWREFFGEKSDAKIGHHVREINSEGEEK